MARTVGTAEGFAALAAAHGVATSYSDHAGRRHGVDPDVVVAVLAQLGVEAGSAAAIRAERSRLDGRRRAPPPVLVLRQGRSHPLRPPLPERGVLVAEDGAERPVAGELPADLPLGWYTLADTTVVLTPRRLAAVPSTWGWMVQLYALHSRDSRGIGDFADLRALLRWSTGLGAGAVLLNPLGAPGLTPTVQPSPYSPSSRRFVNPLYLRVEDTAEFARADPEVRARVAALRVERTEPLDYDAVWAAKRQALELLWPYAERRPVDGDLADFATYCALAERHGPAWRRWPAGLRRPDGPDVAAARAERAEAVAFHAWLQRCCAAQLARARAAGRDMAVGVIHDLAVGGALDGADTWALQDVLATEVTVGAPPDDFNQRGQDWQLPPWRPDALAATGYLPYRNLLRSVLAHADGVRVDHVAGLWRLWWIPPGNEPDRGTYVHYDADALLGILALEAARAGAMVVGEDLGTVEPVVGEELADRGALGAAVLWFQRDERSGSLLAPRQWQPGTLASISTHDLPTAAGFLRGEHVRARAELGLLDDPTAEWARAVAERAELVDLLVAEGLLTGPSAPEAEVVAAMHGLLARTPCRVRLAAFTDALGELRQPNLPGTVDEYPNWRIPLPVPLEEIPAHPGVARAAALLQSAPPPARRR